MPDRELVSKVLAADVLNRLDTQVAETHALVEEVKSLHQSNKRFKRLTWGVLAIAIIAILGSVLATVGVIRVDNTITQQNIDRIEGCQTRNSNTRQLVDSQLSESLANVDNFLQVVLPTAKDPAAATQIAGQWKDAIVKTHNARVAKEVVYVDCDLNGKDGDTGDFPPS
jgi:type II secretory pathway pseudopilin PulG